MVLVMRSYMKSIEFLSFCLSVFLSFDSQANWKSTASYVEKLLSDGKKVAILLIDMQEGFSQDFMPEEQERVLSEQVKLLNYCSEMEGVHVVNVNWPNRGETIADLHFQVKKYTYEQLFFKTTGDAFKQVSATPADTVGTVIEGKLGAELREQGIKDVIPIGCFDSYCVKSTAEGALKEGFNVAFDSTMNIVVKEDIRRLIRMSPQEFRAASSKQWDTLQTQYKESLVRIPGNSSAAADHCET